MTELGKFQTFSELKKVTQPLIESRNIKLE
jgi:hypothetical protein